MLKAEGINLGNEFILKCSLKTLKAVLYFLLKKKKSTFYNTKQVYLTIWRPTENLMWLIEFVLTGAGGAALLGVDFGVLAVDDTLDLRLSDDTFLSQPGGENVFSLYILLSVLSVLLLPFLSSFHFPPNLMPFCSSISLSSPPFSLLHFHLYCSYCSLLCFNVSYLNSFLQFLVPSLHEHSFLSFLFSVHPSFHVFLNPFFLPMFCSFLLNCSLLSLISPSYFTFLFGYSLLSLFFSTFLFHLLCPSLPVLFHIPMIRFLLSFLPSLCLFLTSVPLSLHFSLVPTSFLLFTSNTLFLLFHPSLLLYLCLPLTTACLCCFRSEVRGFHMTSGLKQHCLFASPLVCWQLAYPGGIQKHTHTRTHTHTHIPTHLTASGCAGFGGAGPGYSALIRSSIQHATWERERDREIQSYCKTLCCVSMPRCNN